MSLEGTVEDIIYQSRENGYAVILIMYEDEKVVCTGLLIELKVDDEVKLFGEYMMHPSYGKQFKVSSFVKLESKKNCGIRKILSSGLISGVGEKLAKKIVDKFGEKTFEIIDQEPSKLTQIPGISKEKAYSISEQYKSEYELKNVMLALNEYEFSAVMAIKIYDKYKEKTLDVLKENPYALARDIEGVGFTKADELAKKIGVEREHWGRIKAGILFVLNAIKSDGHTCCSKVFLEQEVMRLLDVDIELVNNAMEMLNLERKLVIKVYDSEVMVCNIALYYKEQEIAKRLMTLASAEKKLNANFDVRKEMAQTERELKIDLVKEQREAIINSMVKGVTVITGGPGTGKTTIIKALIHMVAKLDETVLLAAPTGRAAKRMEIATQSETKTIHRLLEIAFNKDKSFESQFFCRNEDNPLETDVLIVDEISMVDIYLMDSILKALRCNQRLVLIGDTDQLPSVGAGNILRDIIKSGKIKVIRLEQVFRQAKESAIIINAHKINHGEEIIANKEKSDFFIIDEKTQNDVKNTLVDLMTKRLPAKYEDLDVMKDVQILVPMRKGLLGVHELNGVMQNALNLKSDDKEEYEYRNTLYRVGDKVMQTKNNYNLIWKVPAGSGLVVDEGMGVYNGDMGVIKEIDKYEKVITVEFDGKKRVDYEYANLGELDLSYVTTIHKSQGSEYPIVILPLFSGPTVLLSRNLLYTAVTRAKKMVIIVGNRETIRKMISNNKEVERDTSLLHHLRSSI